MNINLQIVNSDTELLRSIDNESAEIKKIRNVTFVK